MLRLPPFRFYQPGDLAQALDVLASEGPAARLVAGGTDLWPNMKRRHQKAASVVSLMKIEELAGMRQVGSNGDRALSIGSTTRLDQIAADRAVEATYPALARAVRSISSPPLRNMATIGGNLCLDTRCTYYNQTEEWRRSIDYCLKEEGTVCWVAPGSDFCWAHSASDAAPMLIALGATVTLRGPGGGREISLSDLYQNDGIRYLTMLPGEVLTAVNVPASSGAERCKTAFWKLRRRGSIDFAVLSAAVALKLTGGGDVESLKVVLGAVASRPLEVEGVGDLVAGSKLDLDGVRAVAQAARKAATPMDNTDFRTQWRGLMVERYVEAALCEAAGLAHDRFPPPHV